MPLTITREMIEKDPFFEEGKKEGLKEGLKEGKKEDIVKLYTKLSLSIEKIAQVLDVPVDFVKDTLKENGYPV
ncbi:MAG: hypothetical protein N2Z81_07405 [Hydrogenothermaceae bacterium]|nr:hypothetical protein [Hydrogenothermaceae bacterium]